MESPIRNDSMNNLKNLRIFVVSPFQTILREPINSADAELFLYDTVADLEGGAKGARPSSKEKYLF